MSTIEDFDEAVGGATQASSSAPPKRAGATSAKPAPTPPSGEEDFDAAVGNLPGSTPTQPSQPSGPYTGFGSGLLGAIKEDWQAAAQAQAQAGRAVVQDFTGTTTHRIPGSPQLPREEAGPAALAKHAAKTLVDMVQYPVAGLVNLVTHPAGQTVREIGQAAAPYLSREFTPEEARGQAFGVPAKQRSFYERSVMNPEEYAERTEEWATATEFGVGAAIPFGPLHGAETAAHLRDLDIAKQLHATPFDYAQVRATYAATPEEAAAAKAAKTAEKKALTRPLSFTTVDGKKYQVTDQETTIQLSPDGKPEQPHPGAKTVYAKPEDAAKLMAGLKGEGERQVHAKEGKAAVHVQIGADKAGYSKEHIVPVRSRPAEGYIPIQLGADGKPIFGNPIKEVEKPPKSVSPNSKEGRKVQQGTLSDDLPMNDFMMQAVKNKAPKEGVFQVMKDLHEGKIDEAEAKARIRSITPRPPEPTPAHLGIAGKPDEGEIPLQATPQPAPAAEAPKAPGATLTKEEVEGLLGPERVDKATGKVTETYPEGYTRQTWAEKVAKEKPERLALIREALQKEKEGRAQAAARLETLQKEGQAREERDYQAQKRPGETKEEWLERSNREQQNLMAARAAEAIAKSDTPEVLAKKLADHRERIEVAKKVLEETKVPYLRQMQEKAIKASEQAIVELEAKLAEKAQAPKTPAEAAAQLVDAGTKVEEAAKGMDDESLEAEKAELDSLQQDERQDRGAYNPKEDYTSTLYPHDPETERQFGTVYGLLKPYFNMPAGSQFSLHWLLDKVLQERGHRGLPRSAVYVRDLIKTLRKYVDDVPVHMVDVIKDRDGKENPLTRGAFWYSHSRENLLDYGNKIRIEIKRVAGDDYRQAVDFLHEVIHAATSRWLAQNPTHHLSQQLMRAMTELTHRNIEQLFKDTTAKPGEGLWFYGMTDPWGGRPHELLAEAFTNTSFGRWIATSPMSSKGLYQLREYTSKFANILKQIFGLDKNQGTVLDDVLHLGVRVMEKQNKMLKTIAQENKLARYKSDYVTEYWKTRQEIFKTRWSDVYDQILKEHPNATNEERAKLRDQILDREAREIVDKKIPRPERQATGDTTKMEEIFPGAGPKLKLGTRVRLKSAEGHDIRGKVVGYSDPVRADSGRLYFPHHLELESGPEKGRVLTRVQKSQIKEVMGAKGMSLVQKSGGWTTSSSDSETLFYLPGHIRRDMETAHGALKNFFEPANPAHSVGSVHWLLNRAINSLGNGYLKNYLQLVRKHIDDIPVKMVTKFTDEKGQVRQGAMGEFNYNQVVEPAIQIANIKLLYRPGDAGVMKTFVHELTHAVTSRFIHSNPDHPLVKRLEFRKKQLDKILDEARAQTGKNLWYYGLQRGVHDLVAEVYSHAPFMNFVGRAEGFSPRLANSLARTIKFASSAVYDLARAAIGLPAHQGGLLKDIMGLSEQIMAKESQIRAEGPRKWFSYGQSADDALKHGVRREGPMVEEARARKARTPPLPQWKRRVPSTPVVKHIPGADKLEKAWEYMLRAVAPESLSRTAERAGALIGSRISEFIHASVQWQHASRDRLHYWQKNLHEVTNFMRDFEQGKILPGHKHYDIAQIYKNWAFNIFTQDFLLSGVIYAPREHYLPHLFKDREGVEDFFRAKYRGKWGDPSFMKDRTFSMYEEAVKAGFTPLYRTPEEIMLARQRASDVALARVQMLDDLSQKGLAIKKRGGKVAKGWTTWRAPNDTQYHVPNDVAQILFNWDRSHSLWNDVTPLGDAYKGWMFIKNHLVPWRLAGSAFHVLHIAGIDVANSNLMFLKDITENPVRALGTFLSGNTLLDTMIRSPWAGSKIIKAIKDEKYRATLGQHDLETLTRMTEGSFCPVLADMHKSAAYDSFRAAIRQGSASATWKLPWAVLDALGKPVFEWWIPNLKAAAYAKQTSLALELNPMWKLDDEARKIGFRKIGKSIDNRYGEMSYDTTFWHRIVKNVGVASTLSLGWQLGFIREFGGAIPDAASWAVRGNKIQRFKEGQLDKPLFATLYTAQALTIGGLMTWAFTGKPPQRLLDYVYPVIGQNPDGTPQRVNTMYYTREFGSIWKHYQNEGLWPTISETVINKGSGVLGTLEDALNGVDKFGKQLSDPQAPGYKQLEQRLGYTLSEFEPISIKALNDPQSYGRSAAWPLLGFSPAPRYVTETHTEGQIRQSYQRFVAPREKPYDRVIMSREMDRLRVLYKAEDPTFWDEFDRVSDQFKLTTQEEHRLRQRLMDPKEASVNMFKRIGEEAGWKEQKKLLDGMSKQNREYYLPYADKKHLRRYYDPDTGELE